MMRGEAADAARNKVLVADGEARAGRCCLCAYTMPTPGDWRRRVLVHQATTHFRHQVLGHHIT